MSLVQVKMEDASLVKRTLYNLCMPYGYDVAQRRMGTNHCRSGSASCTPLGSSLCLAHCAITSGFGASVPYTGGAALGPEVSFLPRPWDQPETGLWPDRMWGIVPPA